MLPRPGAAAGRRGCCVWGRVVPRRVATAGRRGRCAWDQHVTRERVHVRPMRLEHLRGATAIHAVLAEGRRAHGPAMTVHVRPRGDGRPSRATVVAGRKVGGAVQRNRAKRRLRAALQAHGGQGVDMVVVARLSAVTADYDALCGELTRLIAKASRGGTT